MPMANPAAESDTRAFEATLDSFRGAIKDVVRARIPNLTLSQFFKFLIEHVESHWQDEGKIQKTYSQESEQDLVKAQANLKDGYRTLSRRLSEDITLLFEVDKHIQNQPNISGAELPEKEVSVSISFLAKWLSSIQNPEPWEPLVAEAHSLTGVKDRIHAQLEIQRGGGIEI